MKFHLAIVPILAVLVAAYVLFPRATPRSGPVIPSEPHLGSEARETDQAQSGAPSVLVASGAPHPSQKLGDWSCSDPPLCGEPTAKPKPLTVKASDGISGTASWYDYIPGGAAAGPRLRAFLGPHWRGGIVRVCAGSSCVVAQLSDWCACNTGAEKLIDLDDGLFRALAPLSQGVVSVTVRAIRD